MSCLHYTRCRASGIRGGAVSHEVIHGAATMYEPHRITAYVRDVAATFHPFYHQCRVMTEDAALTQSRLALVNATRIVLRNGLAVIGVSAPETM